MTLGLYTIISTYIRRLIKFLWQCWACEWLERFSSFMLDNAVRTDDFSSLPFFTHVGDIFIIDILAVITGMVKMKKIGVIFTGFHRNTGCNESPFQISVIHAWPILHGFVTAVDIHNICFMATFVHLLLTLIHHTWRQFKQIIYPNPLIITEYFLSYFQGLKIFLSVIN